MRETSDLNLCEKLYILRKTNSGITSQEVANQFETSVVTVAAIVQSRSRPENFSNPPNSRRNLTLNEKVKLVHYQEKHRNATPVGSIFKVHHKSVMRHWMNREKILDMARCEYPGEVKRPLKAKHPKNRLRSGRIHPICTSQSSTHDKWTGQILRT